MTARTAITADTLLEAGDVDEWLASLRLTRSDVEQLAQAKVPQAGGWRLLRTFRKDHLPCCAFSAPDGQHYELYWTDNQVIGALQCQRDIRARAVLGKLAKMTAILHNPPPGVGWDETEVGDYSVSCRGGGRYSVSGDIGYLMALRAGPDVPLPEGVARFATLLENPGKHDFSCTMLELDEVVVKAVQELRVQIASDDLAGEGLEKEVHCTIKYGTHTDDIEEVKKVLKSCGLREVRYRIGKLSTFPPSEHSDGATVLKFDIESEDLEKLNAAISKELKATDSFPEYHPHMTVAYVKTDAADKYLGQVLDAGGPEHVASRICFSQQDGTQIRFDLSDLAPLKESEEFNIMAALASVEDNVLNHGRWGPEHRAPIAGAEWKALHGCRSLEELMHALRRPATRAAHYAGMSMESVLKDWQEDIEAVMQDSQDQPSIGPDDDYTGAGGPRDIDPNLPLPESRNRRAVSGLAEGVEVRGVWKRQGEPNDGTWMARECSYRGTTLYIEQDLLHMPGQAAEEAARDAELAKPPGPPLPESVSRNRRAPWLMPSA